MVPPPDSLRTTAIPRSRAYAASISSRVFWNFPIMRVGAVRHMRKTSSGRRFSDAKYSSAPKLKKTSSERVSI